MTNGKGRHGSSCSCMALTPGNDSVPLLLVESLNVPLLKVLLEQIKKTSPIRSSGSYPRPSPSFLGRRVSCLTLLTLVPQFRLSPSTII